MLSRLPYYKEYEGKSIDDIEESAKEDQADLIDSFNDSIASKLSLYEKGKQIILAKAKANIAPPNIPAMVSEIIDNSGEENESNYAFIRIYGKDPENDIGVAVDTTTGKIEISDENEEADPELLDAVTALISDPEAYETVYSSQNESLCQRIIDSNKVPANMFFSKNKRYAQGYLQDGRDIITFKIQNKYISRHSDVDWMSRSEAPVMNARYL